MVEEGAEPRFTAAVLGADFFSRPVDTTLYNKICGSK